MREAGGRKIRYPAVAEYLKIEYKVIGLFPGRSDLEREDLYANLNGILAQCC